MPDALAAQINPAGAGSFITGMEAVQKVRACAPAAPAAERRGRRRASGRARLAALLRLTPASPPLRPQRKSVVKITTGSHSVDEVLGGGVESQASPPRRRRAAPAMTPHLPQRG